MYKISLLTSLSIGMICVLSIQVGATGSCQIENGPIPELAQYQRSVMSRLSEMTAASSANCGTNPLTINTMRTAEVIDRVFSSSTVSSTLFADTFLDFIYRVRTTISGDARSPAMRDGMIFTQIDARINASIASITRSCNLDTTSEAEFVSLLRENHTLENIFKQAVLGTPVPPTGLSEPNIVVANAINSGYVPVAIVACETTQGKSFDDIMTKLTQTIENNGGSNEGIWNNWKKALALFQGGGTSMTIEEKTALQRKLLRDEISRQGFSPRMAQTILGNFDCFKGEIKDNSIEEAVRAKEKCMQNPILGIENFDLKPWMQAVSAAHTTDERVYRVNELSSHEKLLTDITKTYASLSTKSSPFIDTKSVLMSNLIDMHLSLLFTSQEIEKRIPAMYRNCSRAQPGIPCPQQ